MSKQKSRFKITLWFYRILINTGLEFPRKWTWNLNLEDRVKVLSKVRDDRLTRILLDRSEISGGGDVKETISKFSENQQDKCLGTCQYAGGDKLGKMFDAGIIARGIDKGVISASLIENLGVDLGFEVFLALNQWKKGFVLTTMASRLKEPWATSIASRMNQANVMSLLKEGAVRVEQARELIRNNGIALDGLTTKEMALLVSKTFLENEDPAFYINFIAKLSSEKVAEILGELEKNFQLSTNIIIFQLHAEHPYVAVEALSNIDQQVLSKILGKLVIDGEKGVEIALAVLNEVATTKQVELLGSMGYDASKVIPGLHEKNPEIAGTLSKIDKKDLSKLLDVLAWGGEKGVETAIAVLNEVATTKQVELLGSMGYAASRVIPGLHEKNPEIAGALSKLDTEDLSKLLNVLAWGGEKGVETALAVLNEVATTKQVELLGSMGDGVGVLLSKMSQEYVNDLLCNSAPDAKSVAQILTKLSDKHLDRASGVFSKLVEGVDAGGVLKLMDAKIIARISLGMEGGKGRVLNCLDYKENEKVQKYMEAFHLIEGDKEGITTYFKKNISAKNFDEAANFFEALVFCRKKSVIQEAIKLLDAEEVVKCFESLEKMAKTLGHEKEAKWDWWPYICYNISKEFYRELAPRKLEEAEHYSKALEVDPVNMNPELWRSIDEMREAIDRLSIELIGQWGNIHKGNAPEIDSIAELKRVFGCMLEENKFPDKSAASQSLKSLEKALVAVRDDFDKAREDRGPQGRQGSPEEVFVKDLLSAVQKELVPLGERPASEVSAPAGLLATIGAAGKWLGGFFN